jgi:hypothetical protein
VRALAHGYSAGRRCSRRQRRGVSARSLATAAIALMSGCTAMGALGTADGAVDLFGAGAPPRREQPAAWLVRAVPPTVEIFGWAKGPPDVRKPRGPPAVPRKARTLA